MNHGLKLGDEEFEFGLSRAAEGYRLHIGEESIEIDLYPGGEGNWILHTENQMDTISVAVDGDNVHIHLDGETYSLTFEHALDRLSQLNEDASADSVKATMPGSIVSLDVSEGDHVKQGQALLIMESMKMETTIVASRDGVVKTLHLDVGQTFDKDALLVTLEAEAEE